MNGSVVVDGLVAAAAGAVLSGIPSTVHALATGRSILDATAAAGDLAVPSRWPRIVRIATGGLVHLVVSASWGVVLAHLLPRTPTRRAVATGAVAGAAIAALDLGVIGRRVESVRRLPGAAQVADHLAFGAVVGWVLSRRRLGSETSARHG